MTHKSITDVFFDLDHTLWDFDKNSFFAFQRVFKTHEIALDVQVFVETYEPINLDYWRLFREEKVSKQELRRGRLIDAFSVFDITFPVDSIDAMAESYIDELPVDNHLLEGSMDILNYLAEKYRLHIITNGFQQVQLLKLKNSGISDFFETVTSSEEVGAKKPNPLVFETALQKGKTKASQSIMIGDSFEADILGAETVGMETLFYNYRNETIPEGYKLIDSLLEIKKFL
ncbi:YjjG family noncanonical pyrimidine nucleotidase [Ulvibacter litoralis]|uniref:Putative hydrolase of the HAD superfamily n=1 Tax=Ulvibacter litoralis TaxID=227084 RepID=A0A1G7C0Y7_9FLAO|nr:YjjG family noncanonical pyrimidine nucleotidase [Ulvibacter litoralis]GHC49205.1 noncanonical pyrimidine nucleotidase, YjjG family protein [Ulvibacter litoralis]SDE32450.1 putative hydrolase of the HAD superfamily [Ulvibacter litoralis]